MVWRMSPYERRRGGNAPPGGSRGRPGAGNARSGQRGSGHSVATTVGRQPDTALGSAGPASWRRGDANSTASGRRVRQHRSFAPWGKVRPEKWRAEPRPEPDSGNPTVRDRRGASGNVASRSMILHARARLISISTPARWDLCGGRAEPERPRPVPTATDGLPRFLVWVSAGAQPASRVGCARRRDRGEEGELGARPGFPGLLLQPRPSLAGAVCGAPDRGSEGPAAGPEVDGRRGHREWVVDGVRGGRSARGFGFSVARERLRALRLRPMGRPMEERHARGDVVIVRFADDAVVGFERQDDAERFWADLRDRLARFNLKLNAEKTRLIEFGRFAAERRAARGLGKPETFRFLGFTHVCGKTRKTGRFKLKRITDSKRMWAKLRALKGEIERRRHLPIPEQAHWLASVLRGHYQYYAVPENIEALRAFRRQVVRHWLRALRRRSQRTTVTWERMSRLEARWLPQPRILHPWPERRFDAKTQAGAPGLKTPPPGFPGGGRTKKCRAPPPPPRTRGGDDSPTAARREKKTRHDATPRPHPPSLLSPPHPPSKTGGLVGSVLRGHPPFHAHPPHIHHLRAPRQAAIPLAPRPPAARPRTRMRRLADTYLPLPTTPIPGQTSALPPEPKAGAQCGRERPTRPRSSW